MHAEKCPICNGDGVTFPRDEGSCTIGYKIVCHGCNGLGWVQVKDVEYLPLYNTYKVPEATG